MGISYEEAHTLAREVRHNLGIGPDESLRDGIRDRHAATEIFKQQFGRFNVRYIKQHEEHLEEVGRLLLEAEKMYQSAGVPLKHDIAVGLHGGGLGSHAAAVYHLGSNPPAIQVAPKAYKDASFLHTLIHELGHYYHDKVVPGGETNFAIQTKFMWAVRQKRTQEGGSRDVLKRRLDFLNKRYFELQEDQYLRKPLPRKGVPFEFDPWIDGVQYHVKGKIVGKRDSRTVNVEIIEAPEKYLFRQSIYRRGPGPLVVPEAINSLTYAGKDPAKEKELVEVDAERTEVHKSLEGEMGKHDDRYQVQLHDWVPTSYSRKNHLEWFAELMTTLVLGHLKEEPAKWLLSVIQTGEGPKVDSPDSPPAAEENPV
jgi:hypothetical protein